MGYMLPLRFIKASNDLALCATRIVALMSTDTLQARKTIKEERRAGTLINAAGRLPVKTAIILDNGTVIASPMTITRLMNAIEKSNHKSATPGVTHEPVRLKVYDVADEAPPEGFEEDIDELIANIDEDEEELEEEDPDTPLE